MWCDCRSPCLGWVLQRSLEESEVGCSPSLLHSAATLSHSSWGAGTERRLESR